MFGNQRHSLGGCSSPSLGRTEITAIQHSVHPELEEWASIRDGLLQHIGCRPR